MEKRKELNLGYSNFKGLRQKGYYFVDKSLFIEEIIKSQKAVVLFPRPRRFGKTMNLTMLRTFFDISEPENEKLFHELKIWQSDQDVKKHQAKYPVIYLSFKDVKGNNWEEAFSLLKSELVALYNQHDYLLNSGILKEAEIFLFKKITMNQADFADFANSLKYLSSYLFRYFKQDVVILIDEYDTPIQSGYKKFYNEVVSFMRTLLSGAFKDNDYLYKGVITGILRVSKESIFSGLNNIAVYSITDLEFADKFGFTEDEVKRILTETNVTTEFEEVKKWYNGYKIGENSDIYNPWSILNYAVGFQSGFKSYWANSASPQLLKESINRHNATEIRDDIQKLLSGETIVKELEENFVFPDLETNNDLFWSLLTYSGYLTVLRKIESDTYELKIPNYELKTVFKKIIKEWLDVEIKVQHKLITETFQYLINNQISKFETGFRKVMSDTFSYFDTSAEPERVYQAYVLGLLAVIGDDYIIKSNRESGEGRYDIMLIPHDKTLAGVVIEIKQISKIGHETAEKLKDRVNKTIDLAYNQINENEYYKELLANKIDRIIKLPIVFVGKMAYVNKL